MMRPSSGGNEILDTWDSDRVVALVYVNEEAAMIMAFLNGHLEIAYRMHAEFTERLDRSQGEKSVSA